MTATDMFPVIITLVDADTGKNITVHDLISAPSKAKAREYAKGQGVLIERSTGHTFKSVKFC